MSNSERQDERPIPSDLAVVAAFVDAEAVDATALRDALASDEARQYFVDLIVLRQSVVRMGPTTLLHVSPRRGVITRRMIAAVIAFLAVGGVGYLAGERASAAVYLRQPSSASVEAVVEAPPLRAPTPTHVIRLEPGVNWHVEGGG
jgi:hypothetical protein